MDPRIEQFEQGYLKEETNLDGSSKLTLDEEGLRYYLQKVAGLISAGQALQAEQLCSALYLVGIKHPGLRAAQGVALGLLGEIEAMMQIFTDPAFVAAMAEAPELRRFVERSVAEIAGDSARFDGGEP